MKRFLPAVLIAVAGLALAAPVFAQEGKGRGGDAEARANQPLPIRNLTLYRSGVGYFERRGMVDVGQKVQLRFATEQINDMLKSMVILDEQKGLQSVGYGSKEPLDRRLASFGVNISDNPSMAVLLDRLRGSPVKVKTDEGETSGTIVNVESRPTVLSSSGAQGASQTVANLMWINLLTPTGVVGVNLTKVRGFEILDPALAGELNKALAALAEHRADRVKTVDMTFAGTGARPVVIEYVHEMPVWKTSYRLVLAESGDKKGDKDKGQPTIQGWAIVENTTDEDWENVNLSLVAGRPVSFQMDLYEPLHVFRPEIPVPQVPGVMPREYADGMRFGEKAALADARSVAPASPAPMVTGGVAKYRDVPKIELSEALGRSQGGGGGAQSPFRNESDRDAGPTGDDMSRYAAAAQAQAGEIGEVFQYQMKTPVSIARQRSAMLPILSSAIEGRRVSIFSRADGSEHPMRGVEIKNNSGLQLMPGPISVFDGAAYAGDAQIGHVSIGDKRLLAYAVDLEVQTITKEDSTSVVRKVRIVNGLIEQTVKQQAKVSYAFGNKDEKRPRVLIVEQPKVKGWDLTEPKKATEETETLYRFEISLAAKESGKIDIVQEHTDLQSFGVTSYDLGTLVGYLKGGAVSQKVVDAVKKAADMQAAINGTQNRINQLDQEKAGIDADQNRLRQNMNSVARDTDLYRRYTGKLNEQETRLETMRDLREKEVATLNRQNAELQAYVAGLNVE